MSHREPPATDDTKTLERPCRPAGSDEALRGREAQYRTLFELMPGSVVLLDPQGFVRDANPFFCQHIGYTREELLGVHVTKFSQEAPEIIAENIRRMLAGEMLEHEITNVQKDGSPRFYELREAAITLPDGSRGILAVSNDVTERKRAERGKLEMERQLLHVQKLESLGVLAGGIAHDFNNLLAAMMGNVELAMMDLPATSPAQKSLKITLAAGRRAANLTRQMLDFSGRGRFDITDVDLTHLVAELAELLKVSISKSARLELRLAPHLHPIRADASQLQQVVMNLITNASEAIGEQQGSITISIGEGDYDAAHVAESRLAIKPPPGRFVFLEVRDTGCGMDESVQEKLFDPFFTTKFVGRGLGMSCVLGVVQGHQGAIMVSSQPGQGTTIRVLFPASPAPAANEARTTNPPPRHASPILPALSGTVLIAEDEAPLGIFLESFMSRMGLRVISATDGEEAVALFEQHAGEITFVFLDLTMPKLDGLKTLAEIRRRRPGIQAVLASGYDGGDLTSRYREAGFAAFIQKPYDLEVLTKLVHQMCASQS